MFFFFFEEEDINKELIKKLEAFKKSIDSNDIELKFNARNESDIDVIYKNNGICSLEFKKLSDEQLLVKINRFKTKGYKLIQDKSYFDKYWKENIPQKSFYISLEEESELKRLFNLIIGLRDTFLSDVIVEFKINEVSFKDYRRFKDEKFKFNNKMNVLIGKNGCGKTSVLEGVATGIGAFLSGIDEITDSKNIYKKDVRFSIEEVDYMPVRNDYLPTQVLFKSRFINQDIEWSRTKASLENGRTTTKDSSVVTTVVR